MNEKLTAVRKTLRIFPTNSRKVTVQRIHKPARKVIVKRGVKASDYWSYCNETGCDVWGLLKSIKSISGEPVALWLPVKYRNPVTNEYVQGVEVEMEYQEIVPAGFDIIEFPEADYLLFRSDPYDDEDYESAILDVKKVIAGYDFYGNGYVRDENNPGIQLEPVCTRGYIEMIPVKSR